MKKTFCNIIIAISACCFSYGQYGALPSLTSGLFEVQWVEDSIRGVNCEPLIIEGFLFHNLSSKYAINVKTGKKYYFGEDSVSLIFNNIMKDKIFYFGDYKYDYIRNIVNGDLLYSVKSSILEVRPISSRYVYLRTDSKEIMKYDVYNKIPVWKSRKFNGYITNVLEDPKGVFIKVSNSLQPDSIFRIDIHDGTVYWGRKYGFIKSNILDYNENLFVIQLRDKGVGLIDKFSGSYTKILKDYYIGNNCLFDDKLLLYNYTDGKAYLYNKNFKEVWENNADINMDNIGYTEKFILGYSDFMNTIIAIDKKTGETKYCGWGNDLFKIISTSPYPESEYTEHKVRFSNIWNNYIVCTSENGKIVCYKVNE